VSLVGSGSRSYRVLRVTQLGFLRLMTTAAAMDGKPLTVAEAWQVHDWLFEDDRVVFLLEPEEVEIRSREYAAGRASSPKRWADAWLLAFAGAAEGTVITFDLALGARGARCLVVEAGGEHDKRYPSEGRNEG